MSDKPRIELVCEKCGKRFSSTVRYRQCLECTSYRWIVCGVCGARIWAHYATKRCPQCQDRRWTHVCQKCGDTFKAASPRKICDRCHGSKSTTYEQRGWKKIKDGAEEVFRLEVDGALPIYVRTNEGKEICRVAACPVCGHHASTGPELGGYCSARCRDEMKDALVKAFEAGQD